jgi:hypothetical protein
MKETSNYREFGAFGWFFYLKFRKGSRYNTIAKLLTVIMLLYSISPAITSSEIEAEKIKR